MMINDIFTVSGRVLFLGNKNSGSSCLFHLIREKGDVFIKQEKSKGKAGASAAPTGGSPGPGVPGRSAGLGHGVSWGRESELGQ